MAEDEREDKTKYFQSNLNTHITAVFGLVTLLSFIPFTHKKIVKLLLAVQSEKVVYAFCIQSKNNPIEGLE